MGNFLKATGHLLLKLNQQPKFMGTGTTSYPLEKNSMKSTSWVTEQLSPAVQSFTHKALPPLLQGGTRTAYEINSGFSLLYHSHIFYESRSYQSKGKQSPLSPNRSIELCYTQQTLLCHILLPASKSTLPYPKFYLSQD